MHEILRMLQGGDRRSIGRSNDVVSRVLEDPTLLEVVFAGMRSDDPVLRMRCADAAEKTTRQHPEYLRPFKIALIKHLAAIEQKEVRWHVAPMLARLELSDSEQTRIVGILLSYLNDRSSIVKTFAMQALADMALLDPKLRPSVVVHLRELSIVGTAAMKARGRKLLARLER